MQDPALVTATFSRRMRLRLADGQDVEARIKGKRQKPVCGDRVTAEALPGETDWLITDILERRNALTRPNLKGLPETLAANVDMLCVVAAPTPKPDWFIVDRYLGAAELMGAGAIVVFNKKDLLDDSGLEADVDAAASDYRRVGYEFIVTSAETGEGLGELAKALDGRTSIFVGQSGVGKSSLINVILDQDAQKTAALSEKHREGRHTTVNSVMLDLPGGGAVIDSPGVRDYAPAVAADTPVAVGFREISDAADGCRFGNCQHLREPDCAVKQAVADGAIGERRYESYRRLLRLSSELLTRGQR